MTQVSIEFKVLLSAVVGAKGGIYNYFAEMETAGKCFEWVKEHLALDEIGIYLQKQPITDSDAAGMFFNIKLDTGKTEMLRAVLEGICFHLKWMLECSEKKVKTSDVIRFENVFKHVKKTNKGLI